MCSRLLRPTGGRDALEARDVHEVVFVGIVVFAIIVMHSPWRV
jgi:hypothetical protein